MEVTTIALRSTCCCAVIRARVKVNCCRCALFYFVRNHLYLPQYVHRLTPRGQYTSGKGSSAVGLTASVNRDPDTKHFVLQTWAEHVSL